MKSILLILVFFAGISGQAFSQFDETRIGLALDPLYADAWNANSHMSGSIRARLYHFKLGSVAFNADRAFLDTEAYDIIDKIWHFPYKAKHHEIGLQYHLFKSDESAFVLRTGWSKFKAGTSRTWEHEDNKNYYFLNDTIDSTYQVGFGQGYNGIYGLFTLLKMNVYHFGMGGHIQGKFDFFFDVLLCPDGDKRYWYPIGDGTAPFINYRNGWYLKSIEDKKWGWRMGCSFFPFDGHGLSAGFEFGSRPTMNVSGLLGPNTYLTLNAGYGLDFAPKKKAKKKASRDS